MAKCENNGDCNDHGDCIKEHCSCDWGWYPNKDDPCIISGDKKWDEGGWEGFQRLFLILHIILFLVSVFKLYRTLKLDKINNIKRLIDRLFRSPRNLCLFYLACIGLFRCLWLTIDPFSFNRRINRTGDRLLYETVYPFIYGLYSSVLLVWGGLYQGMRPKSSDPFKILRKIIMAMMILAFPISVVTSVLKGYRKSIVWMPIAGLFVSIGILILLFGFLIFGVMLFCYVEKQGKAHKKALKNTIDGQNPYQNLDIDQSIESIPRRINTQRLSLAIPDSRHNTSRESNQSWENLIIEENIVDFPMISDNESEDDNKEPERIPKKRITESSKTFISLITEDDRSIFRKLCFLMMASTILGIMVLVFMIFLTNSNKNLDPAQELGMLYGVFFLELFACLMIFLVFTAQIKVKEKNNLRFFTLISMKMNKKEPKILLPPILANIKNRLKKFYS